MHDELDLCCEDLTKEELKPSQCLPNEEKFIAVVTSMINKAMMIFFELSFEDNYIPQYSAMTFLASSLALICNLITKRPTKTKKKKLLNFEKNINNLRKKVAQKELFFGFSCQKKKICIIFEEKIFQKKTSPKAAKYASTKLHCTVLVSRNCKTLKRKGNLKRLPPHHFIHLFHV